MTEDERKLLLFVASSMLIAAHQDGNVNMKLLLQSYLRPFRHLVSQYAADALRDLAKHGEEL